MKIEKKSPIAKSQTIPFDDMVPGDSLYIEGKSRSLIVQSFGQALSKGRYSLQKEGNGYRFYLLK